MKAFQLPKMPLPHSLASSNFSLAKMTQKLREEKLPSSLSAYHAIFHIIIIRKNIQKKRWRNIIRKFSSSFPSLFFFCLLPQRFSPYLKGMSNAGFLLTPTQTTHFLGSIAREAEEKDEIEGNIKPLYSHLNRITRLIVYPAMCVLPQLSLCAS